MIAQAGQTIQAAGSQAISQQVQPTNVAVPVSSAGEPEVAITQGNGSQAGAASSNDAATTQVAGQGQTGAQAQGQAPAPEPASQPAGAGNAATGQGQTAGQASGTNQGASSQATSQQVLPTNVAIPIVIASPGAKTVVNQTNSSSATAVSANVASTTQFASQGQIAGGVGPVSGSSSPAQPPASPKPPSSPVGGSQTVVTDLGGGVTWVWTWNWDWTWNWTWIVPSSDQPQSSTPGTGSPAPAGGARGQRMDETLSSIVSSNRPASEPGAPIALSRRGDAGAASAEREPAPASATAPAFLTRPLPGPAPSPAPGAAGGLLSPAGLLLAALVALGLQLSAFVFTLGRRFRLSAAAWRRLACVSPLERPG